MRKQEEEIAKEVLELFAKANIDPRTSLSYGVVLKANLFEIKKLKDFVEKQGMYIVFDRTSPGKLFICNEDEHDVLE